MAIPDGGRTEACAFHLHFKKAFCFFIAGFDDKEFAVVCGHIENAVGIRGGSVNVIRVQLLTPKNLPCGDIDIVKMTCLIDDIRTIAYEAGRAGKGHEVIPPKLAALIEHDLGFARADEFLWKLESDHAPFVRGVVVLLAVDANKRSVRMNRECAVDAAF